MEVERRSVYYSASPFDDEHVGTETFANLLINDPLFSYTTTKVSVDLDSIIANRVAR